MLSDYAREHCGSDEKHYKSCAKLVPNLMDKKKYWIHYRNLQFAIDQGLELVKVHQVIEFKQSCWMKPYIDFCVTQRKGSKNEFEKDLYKAFMNIVFGKSMENVRTRRDIQVMHTDTKSWTKFVAEPSYVSRENITDNLVIAERKRKNLNLNLPMYVGFAVLDLSKLHMYDFWYNYIKKEYPGEKSSSYIPILIVLLMLFNLKKNPSLKVENLIDSITLDSLKVMNYMIRLTPKS